MQEGPGHRLAEIREKRQMRQADLARMIGMTRGQLSNIEAGRREISLTDLRKCAESLGVSVVALLLPQDAPDYPNEEEAALLEQLRRMHNYDPHAVLAAVQSVLEAFARIGVAADRPRDLAGDPKLSSKLAHTWNDLSDDQRGRALALLDNAREFSRD